MIGPIINQVYLYRYLTRELIYDGRHYDRIEDNIVQY
jgi:hypothetical protein